MEENVIQEVGIDIGRGYVKGYSQFNDTEYECLFKSIVSPGRQMDFKEYENPLYIEVDGEDSFLGELAEIEGDNPVHNLRDSKTWIVARKLLYGALNQIVVTDRVKIMFGVPNKLFKKAVLKEIADTYKDKVIHIKDKITGSYKTITIVNVGIFREGDAALLWHVSTNHKEVKKAVGLASVGFRTTEFSFFDENLKFIDKLSTSKEIGNKSALEYVQRELVAQGITRTLAEIDSSNKYDKLKKIAYDNLSASIMNEIETMWLNLSEVDVFIAGGTSLKLDLEDYPIIPQSQMATAKGLYMVANEYFSEN